MRSIWRSAVGWLMTALMTLVPKSPTMPRLIKFSLHPFVKRGHAKVLAGGRWQDAGRAFASALGLAFGRIFTPAVAVAAIALMLFAVGFHAGGFALAITPAATTRDLKTIIGELKALQDEYKGKPMPEEVGKRFEALAKEAEDLQKSLDRDRQIRDMEEKGRQVVDPVLPASEQPGATKAEPTDIAGYLTLGEAVVRSPAYQEFVKANFPRGNVSLLVAPQLKRGRGGVAYLPLTHQQKSDWEAKAVPTLGSRVIQPQRLADIVQVTQDDKLVLRDLLNVSGTNRDVIEYVREESFTRAAAPVAHGAAKPQAALEYTLQTTTVRTIAVWIPATVQMLADWPALRNLIDSRLLYDLRKVEEYEVMYGDGTGSHFSGIIPNAGHDIAVADARITTPTIIDDIRVGMTEVARSGFTPNGLAIDPIDWEAVQLMKGSDEHYLAQVFPDSSGAMRIWGLRVVETVAAQDAAGNPTEARNLVVGDWVRGATLWIREEANVQVGMQNDDFTKNLRTILAEERAAFAVQAPDAFAVLETEAAVT